MGHQTLEQGGEATGVGRLGARFDDAPRLRADQLAENGVEAGKDGVLRRRELRADQSRHIGDQHRALDRGSYIVQRQSQRQGRQVMPRTGQDGEADMADRADDRADDQRGAQAHAHHQPARDDDADHGHQRAEHFTHLTDGIQREAEIDIVRVGDVEREFADAIDADQGEDKKRPVVVAGEKVLQRIDKGAVEIGARPGRPRQGQARNDH